MLIDNIIVIIIIIVINIIIIIIIIIIIMVLILKQRLVLLLLLLLLLPGWSSVTPILPWEAWQEDETVAPIVCGELWIFEKSSA